MMLSLPLIMLGSLLLLMEMKFIDKTWDKPGHGIMFKPTSVINSITPPMLIFGTSNFMTQSIDASSSILNAISKETNFLFANPAPT